MLVTSSMQVFPLGAGAGGPGRGAGGAGPGPGLGAGAGVPPLSFPMTMQLSQLAGQFAFTVLA